MKNEILAEIEKTHGVDSVETNIEYIASEIVFIYEDNGTDVKWFYFDGDECGIACNDGKYTFMDEDGLPFGDYWKNENDDFVLVLKAVCRVIEGEE